MLDQADSQKNIPQPVSEVNAADKTPILAGLHAAKANIIPGLIVQSLMLFIVLGYYYYPPVRHALTSVAQLKAHYGLLFSGVSAVIAGGIIPELLIVATLQKGRFTKDNLHNMLFAAVYWGYGGCIVDLLYRCQALLFGNTVTVAAVIKKVCVDQFVFNPVYAAPLVVVVYDWKNSGYSLKAFKGIFNWQFYKNRVIPILFATWAVWIPVMCIVYSLPQLLQVPLFNLALSLWVILVSYMSRLKEVGA